MKFKEINLQTAYAGESESQEDMELDENEASSDEDSDLISQGLIHRSSAAESFIRKINISCNVGKTERISPYCIQQ